MESNPSIWKVGYSQEPDPENDMESVVRSPDQFRARYRTRVVTRPSNATVLTPAPAPAPAQQRADMDPPHTFKSSILTASGWLYCPNCCADNPIDDNARLPATYDCCPIVGSTLASMVTSADLTLVRLACDQQRGAYYSRRGQARYGENRGPLCPRPNRSITSEWGVLMLPDNYYRTLALVFHERSHPDNDARFSNSSEFRDELLELCRLILQAMARLQRVEIHAPESQVLFVGLLEDLCAEIRPDVVLFEVNCGRGVPSKNAV